MRKAAFATVVLIGCGSALSPAFDSQGTFGEVKVEPPAVALIHAPTAVDVLPAGVPPARLPAPIWGAPHLEDTNPDPRVVEVALSAEESIVALSPGRNVALYTYNGFFPGPRLEARAGDRVIVHFTNHLKEPTTVHWHGLRISDQMDGSPRIQTPVPAEGTFTYDFVVPEAGTYWYHPHVRANEQIERGLYGSIVVRAADEPIFDADRFLVLDDILLNGSSFVPFLSGHMEAMMGRYGNFLLINGRISSNNLEVHAKLGSWERWRVVNTANARTMSLQITGATFRVVGTDGGLLKTPFTTDRLELAVGQRYDLEVHFDRPGEVALNSWVLASNGAGGATEIALRLMRVVVDTEVATSPPPVYVTAALPTRSLVATHELAFDAVTDPVMGLMWRINGKAHAMAPLFTAARGDTVLLRLKNLAGVEHPFHLHGQFFEIRNKPLQSGLKDVVLVGPNETVEIVAALDNPGTWMAHCHILEHSELGMMSEFKVTP